ncbi:glycosyltransferase [Arthrobacter sp. TMP15]|uniref:glycosyltransferase n=1 Tax=Arthrobacter sp. TMP15 TaxID=3140789 RepID=UPI0031BAA9AF
MKHDDEEARISALQLAKRKKHGKDLDSLILKYEGALAQLKVRENEAKALKRDLTAMRRNHDQYRLISESATAEIVRLKSSLAALRNSKSIRMGRAISRPIRILRQAPRSVSSALKQNVQWKAQPGDAQLVLSGRSDNASDSNGALIRAAPSSAATEPDAQSVEVSYLALIRTFQLAPSKGNAIRVIYFDYFTCGSLKRPAAFIDTHAELLTGVSTQEQKVLDNIKGQASLLEKPPSLPPRQSNIGYLAERGRIMYCAHSTGKYNSNGYSTRTSGLTQGLQSSGEEVVVVARPGYPWDSKVDIPVPLARRCEEQIGGVTHVFNPGPSWTADRIDQYLAESTDVFVREAQRNRVSLVHAASNYVTSLPALIAARRMGVPFVYEVRGLWEITELSHRTWWGESDRYKLASAMETLVASNADVVLAITREVRAELVTRGVTEARISLLQNAVDTDIFAPMPPDSNLRDKHSIDSEAIILGYAGSLVAYEGVADIVASIGVLRGNGINAVLMIVGDGPELMNLKEQTKQLGITESVFFTGRVASSEVPAYISLFDIMPCPRRRLPVTEMVSPLKPLEAMACGKVMILGDLSPMRELAGRANERALLTTPGDVNSLVTAITTLIDDPSLLQSVGRRARLWTLRERTWRQAGTIAARAHREARLQYSSLEPGVALEQLKIAIISDQFTLEGLRPEADLIVLRPDTWHAQLSGQPIDALFVESAWDGIDGLWKQKVGFYSDEKFDELKSIIKWANEMQVPTIFWNKEDPVHFNRFRKTSKYFDHVFTTDASCISAYMDNAGESQKTVSSLPFYAQPKFHNILPSKRAYDHTVNYAGSYYGDRFAARSVELSKLLSAASSQGLSIYDRQHLNPDSPYHFPDHLSGYVRGGLDYADMVEAYKAHPVHINVNSVADSPTMFSRRVMEIAASGGAVISGQGCGVEDVFAGIVPVIRTKGDAELLIQQWMQDEESRLRDTWLTYRLVHRSHTAAHRLACALRTAGLKVLAPEPAKYGVYVTELNSEVIASLEMQTVLPTEIFFVGEASSIPQGWLATRVESNAEALTRARIQGLKWVAAMGTEPIDRTYFEDLLSAVRFGTWRVISASSKDLNLPGLGMAQLAEAEDGSTALMATDADAEGSLVLRRPSNAIPLAEAGAIGGTTARKMHILIAGHDLKFAGGIIRRLQGLGHKVSIDQWTGHSGHNETLSLELLKDADVVFCEWTLGNAVWYADNKNPNQRLVTRLHLQELSTKYLDKINYTNVESVIFVGQHIADVAIRDHGIPGSIATVIPNYVDINSLAMDKIGDVRFNLGLVGIIPERKRLDIALDVLTDLRAKDDRFKLYIKGKLPEDYPWMSDRPEEMKFYDEQFARIQKDPLLKGAVHFDGHGNDMSEWYRKIGIALSVSNFESFHLTLADGAASGAVPMSLAWSGADQIYPENWLSADSTDLAQSIRAVTSSPDNWTSVSELSKAYAMASFDQAIVLEKIVETIVGTS